MMRDIPEGTLIDDRYKVISRVGSGGMADVYCAEDLQLGRNVAVKLLHRRFSEDDEFVERFRLEASSAAGLQHPHVVSVFDRGEWDDTYYIAMEYLDGRTLKEIVRDDAPLPPLRAVDLITQVLRAAQFAHKRGIIHRDLKPHNVIVDADDRATVTDFGIARAGASEMTQTGSIMGTAQYLSPEQAQGHAVSAASDLYSVGVVLYELLTGKVPFDGDSAVTIALKHVTETAPLPSTLNPAVPPDLDAVVMRSLEKDPTERFTSASEFISALDAVRQQLVGLPAGEVTSQFVPPSLADFDPAETGAFEAVEYEETETVERRKWPWIVALLVILIAGVGALGYFLTRPNEHTVPDVVGRDLASALAVLRNEDFEVSVQRVVNAAPRDRVLRQDPQAQAPADRASTVTLTVSDGPGQATVPDVAGLPLKRARKTLQKSGFSVRVKIVNSSIVKGGRAIRTSPAVGSQIEKDSQITLFISKGPEQVTVPNLKGKSQDSAETQLTGLGLKVDVTEVVSEEDPKTVLAQDPLPDSEVDKGSTINLTVAKENKDVSVPSVIGDTQGEAASALSALGFAVSFVYREVTNPDDDGVVLRQNPSSGSKMKKGGKVNLTVGRLKNTPTSTSTGTTPTTTTPTTP